MSAMLTTDKIYDLFYDDYETEKSFLHSHTHSGNALCAAVALETLKIMKEENIYDHIKEMEPLLYTLMQEIADRTKKIKNIRYIGAMVAADLVTKKKRAGYRVFQDAMQLGAFLRPLGNTIYWLPPLNTTKKTLQQLKNITINAIKKQNE